MTRTLAAPMPGLWQRGAGLATLRPATPTKRSRCAPAGSRCCSPPRSSPRPRAARTLAGLSAAEALGLVTSGAARALGLEGELGTLRPGLWGDIAVVEIDRTDDADAALEAALASGPADLGETTIGGRVVYRRQG